MRSLRHAIIFRRLRADVVGAALSVLLAGHLFAPGVTAGIIGVNATASVAKIVFNDTNSIGPPAGITNTTLLVNPWVGSPVTLPTTTDPNTGDFATGGVDASFIPTTNTYAINFSGITLSQPSPTTTGVAYLAFTFNAEYILDAFGLPNQATLFPNFVVNGTVQGSSGSYASVDGFIDYFEVTASSTLSWMDRVNYYSIWTTPGPFSGTVAGTPINGFTTVIAPGSMLKLEGTFFFKVDPATINAYSVQSVPEPGSITLMASGIAALAFCAHRRRRSSSQ